MAIVARIQAHGYHGGGIRAVKIKGKIVNLPGGTRRYRKCFRHPDAIRIQQIQDLRIA
jgi:hypothetical protein